nr:hypothetical protein [Bacilli bacterium]
MLEVLKEMQKQGIFKLLPNNDLDIAISRFSSSADINKVYDSIQKYLKHLSSELSYKHNVDLARTLSGFEDKFSDEMFDMTYTCKEHLNAVYQKNVKFDKSHKEGSLGIEMFNSTFTLEERKLLKLINHYYISLSNKESFNDSYFFIPIESLRLIFPKVNNIKLKEKIIDTCNQLSSKTIYWDLSKTGYVKKLSKDNLCTGIKEKIVDINILYLPKKNKNGVNGEATEIKGVICRITKFMKLRRRGLKQISNRFPINALKANYLSFIVSEKIDYHLNMIKQGTKEQKKDANYSVNLRNLLDSIYLYKNNKVQSDTYLYQIMNEVNSKANICKIFEAIITSLCNLSNNIEFTPSLIVQKKKIDLTRYISDLKDASNSNEVFNVIDELYEEIVKVSNTHFNQAEVMKLIRNGHISLILDF